MKIALITASLILAFGGGLYLNHMLNRGPSIEIRELRIKDIRRLSKLLCVEIDLQGVREYSIEGYTGTIRCILILHGIRQIGIDLNQARFISQDAENKEALLSLPPPEVTGVKLDHQLSKVYRIDRSGLWKIVPGYGSEVRLVNKALKLAEDELLHQEAEDKILPQSREQAEQLIQGFGEALGWTIRVQWAGEPAAP